MPPIRLTMVLACAVLFGAIGAEPTPDTTPDADLCVSPQQNLALLKKAWQTPVTIDFKNIAFEAAVAAVAKHAGLTIKLSADYKAEFSPGRGAGAPHRLQFWNYEIQPHQFLGWGKEYALKGTTCSAMLTDSTLSVFQFSAPVPAAVALRTLADLAHLDISYRQDGVYLARECELTAELSLTRRYTFKHAWGGVLRNISHDGQDVQTERRVNFLDMVTAVVCRRLGHDRDPGRIRIAFDEKTKELTLTAPARTMYCFETLHLRGLDAPSPEDIHADTLQFRRARMSELGAAEWAKLSAGLRGQITAAVKNLGGDEFAVRQDASGLLSRIGPGALKPLLELNPAQLNADLADRLPKLLLRIYSEYEYQQVFAQGTAYLKAGMAGDVQTIRDKFLSAERKAQFENEQQAFATQATAIGADARAIKGFLVAQTMAAGTPVDQVTYTGRLAQNLRVAEAKIERIYLSGRHARITFSALVPDAHPLKEFQQQIKVERPVSDLYLIFEHGQWLAGPWCADGCEGTAVLHWTPQDGLTGPELEALNTKVTRVSTPKSETLSVSAYCIPFGY